MLRLDRCIALKWAVAIVVAVNCGTVWGSELSRTDPSQTNLQLEVVINDAPIGMIAGFVLNSRHRIGATPAELEDIGLRLRGKLPADRVVQLDDIPTLRYSYNERLQTIQIWVDNAYRKGKIFDLSAPSAPDQPRSQASWGAVVNYNLLASSNAIPSAFTFNGSSLTLDARAFSPYGTFQQSGIVRTGPQSFTDVVRLNTSFRYSDQDRLVSYTAGDTITGGLPWSRPVRIGGFQAQSNFSLRPDLVTMPLPSLSGSAAVPSTLDVYVNNMRTFSQDVPAGPFSLNNIPLVSGAGNAELVIRDSAGRETKSVLPFYASSSLLAPGLMSWSVEAGLPRLSYGSSSDAYVGSPIGSATLRKGIFDWMTVEAHAEGSPRLANGGVGAAFRTGNFGVAGVAVSASTADGDAGFQSYASYETKVFGFNIFASTQRTFGSYQDIASSTAQLALAAQNFSQGALGFFNYLPPGYVAASTRAYGFSVYTSALPPRALDRITFSVPLPFDEKANVSATFLHMRDSSAGVSNIVTATYTRALPLGASFFTTAFHDAGTNKNTGLFAGLSMPLGPSASISTSVSKGQGGFSGSVDAIKSLGPEPGSYGWRVRDAEGAVADRQASVSYRSRYGTIQAGASEVGSNTSAALELRGSITTMDGGVFLSNWIDDGFAVVNVGAPGVEVLNENRPAGVTDAQGMLLIPTLRAYQKNRITVDPVNLPVDAEMEKTHDVVAPADRAGALVKFAVRDNSASALVTFVKADGSFVRAGSRGRLDGRNEFIVGYDGQAFIRDLSASNRISIEAVDGSCGAAFGFSARRGEQVKIGPVVCR